MWKNHNLTFTLVIMFLLSMLTMLPVYEVVYVPEICLVSLSNDSNTDTGPAGCKLNVAAFVKNIPEVNATFAYRTRVKGSEIHDVAVTNVTVSPTKIVVGKFFTSNVTVENQGTSIETFNITLYAAYESARASGNLTILNLTVTDLAPGSSRVLTLEYSMFPWRRKIWPPPWGYCGTFLTANFTIKVEAEVLLGEVDTSDNVYIDGSSIAFWMTPDFTGDGKIDGKDIAIIAKAFGSYPGHPRWNPDADLNQDGRIEGKDIACLLKLFGLIYG